MFCMVMAACKGKEKQADGNGAPEAQKAVCVTDGVPVKAEPGKDGKWLTSLNMGETMLYLNDEFKDPEGKNQDYYKVELSDGSQVWARTYGIVLNAKPAAVLSETPIYKRPDLVNKTDKAFKTLEFLVVVGEKDDWVEVIGAAKKKSGWIKAQYISTNAEDVAVATLAYKSLFDKDGNILTDKLQPFIDGLPYQNTRFNGYLNSLLDEQVGEMVMESVGEIEGYEEEID